MEQLAYSIGFFLGDGNLRVDTAGKRFVRFFKPDREPLERVSRELETMFGFAYKVSLENNKHVSGNYYRLIASNPAIFDFLAFNTAMRTEIPKEFFQAAPSAQLALLAGLIDSDGYVSITSRGGNRADEVRCMMGFGNSLRGLVEQFADITRLCGIKPGQIVTDVPKISHYRTMFSVTLNIRSAWIAGLRLTSERKQQKFATAAAKFSASETMYASPSTQGEDRVQAAVKAVENP